MSRHYTKNAFSPGNRTSHIGAQRAERESFWETKQTLPPRVREQKGWKCDECGIVLKDNYEMLKRHHNQILCVGCYAEQPGKNNRRVKKRRTYKRFMERYSKEWRRRREGRTCYWN